MFKKSLPYFGLALGIILIDQIIKLSVHFFMQPGFMGEISIIGDFFKLHYTLNQGMAFGMQFGVEYGKLILTIFRIIAVGFIGYGLFHFTKKGSSKGLIISIALILGGAIGNLVDSIFYGVFLNNSPYDAISPWFHGQVIDMFFFDFYQGYLPEWLPFLGGTYYSTPIFNFADAAIFCGVVNLIIFQKKYFKID